MTRARRRSAPRGFSMLESVVSLAILGIGLTGLGALQMTAAGANSLGRNTAAASRLGVDLVESITRWNYGDARLTPLASVVSVDDELVADRWDLGTADTIPDDRKPQFSEDPDDTNATTPGALGTYQGLGADVDGDGVPDYARYWTVFDVDGRGKLIQVVVRWRQPGLGQKQVVLSTFKPDPTAVLQ